MWIRYLLWHFHVGCVVVFSCRVDNADSMEQISFWKVDTLSSYQEMFCLIYLTLSSHSLYHWKLYLKIMFNIIIPSRPEAVSLSFLFRLSQLKLREYFRLLHAGCTSRSSGYRSNITLRTEVCEFWRCWLCYLDTLVQVWISSSLSILLRPWKRQPRCKYFRIGSLHLPVIWSPEFLSRSLYFTEEFLRSLSYCRMQPSYAINLSYSLTGYNELKLFFKKYS
jgi:hypothetical protein